MRLWIDCEWNDYKGELISMALVDEGGREWYEVLYCRDPSVWVVENVLPKLGKQPIAFSQLQTSLQAFLSAYTHVLIIADWPEDIQHFCAALVTGPGLRIDTPPLLMEIVRGLNGISENPHNALADANANRRAGLS